MRIYSHQLLIAIDQVFNALFAGYADETISSRAFRMDGQKRRWTIARKMIDSIFFWEKDHCHNAHLAELNKTQLPDEYITLTDQTAD